MGFYEDHILTMENKCAAWERQQEWYVRIQIVVLIFCVGGMLVLGYTVAQQANSEASGYEDGYSIHNQSEYNYSLEFANVHHAAGYESGYIEGFTDKEIENKYPGHQVRR